MFKLKHICAVSAIFGVFFVMAGCATQDVVRKEEDIAPVRAVGPETPAKPSEIPPAKQDVKAPSITQTTPPQPTSSGDESQKASLTALQAALETIYFAYDSSALSETARAQLTKDADLLKEKSAKVRIEGHCDERGSAEYNLALGERRAQAAHQYLVTLGIKPERLSIISYGKEKPAVRGDNETAWMKNRRAEFIVQQ